MNTLTAMGMAFGFVLAIYLALIAIYLVVTLVYRFIIGATVKKIPNSEIPKYLVTGYFGNRKFWLIFTLFFFSIHIFVYASQRIGLVNDERAYPEAKEYFAASGVVTLYRKLLNNYFNVDHPAMQPLNDYHMKFYEKGIAFIPESDGEYDYWKYRFGLYYYVRRHYVPWDDDNSLYMFGALVVKYYKPVLRELMDESFSLMQAIMKKPFQDPVLYNDERYRLLTRVAVFYEAHVLDTYELNCHIKTKCTVRYANDTVLPQKDEIVVEYMKQAMKVMQREDFKERISHIADALLVREWVSARYMDALIGRDLFACDDTHVLEYVDVHRKFEQLVERKEYGAIPKALREGFYERRFFSSEISRISASLLQQKCRINLIYKPTHKSGFSIEELLTIKRKKYNEQ